MKKTPELFVVYSDLVSVAAEESPRWKVATNDLEHLAILVTDGDTELLGRAIVKIASLKLCATLKDGTLHFEEIEAGQGKPSDQPEQVAERKRESRSRQRQNAAQPPANAPPATPPVTPPSRASHAPEEEGEVEVEAEGEAELGPSASGGSSASLRYRSISDPSEDALASGGGTTTGRGDVPERDDAEIMGGTGNTVNAYLPDEEDEDPRVARLRDAWPLNPEREAIADAMGVRPDAEAAYEAFLRWAAKKNIPPTRLDRAWPGFLKKFDPEEWRVGKLTRPSKGSAAPTPPASATTPYTSDDDDPIIGSSTAPEDGRWDHEWEGDDDDVDVIVYAPDDVPPRETPTPTPAALVALDRVAGGAERRTMLSAPLAPPAEALCPWCNAPVFEGDRSYHDGMNCIENRRAVS